VAEQQQSKDKPKLLDRLRQKRQERKQRAAEHARRGAKGGGDIRRDTGVTNTGGGPGI
jgi:hypothetical protein